MMGRKRAGQKDRKKVGWAEGCEEGGRGKGMEGRRAGQKDGKKVGVHCKQTRGDFPLSATGVADQSLPGPEFISVVDTGLTRLQRRNFPTSTRGILKSAGIFRRNFRFNKRRRCTGWDRTNILLHTNLLLYLSATAAYVI